MAAAAGGGAVKVEVKEEGGESRATGVPAAHDLLVTHPNLETITLVSDKNEAKMNSVGAGS